MPRPASRSPASKRGAQRKPPGAVRRPKGKRKPKARPPRESAFDYRRLFERNPLPMWVYDLETLRFLAVNDAAVAHYGYTRDALLAMTIKEIRPVEDVPRLLEDVTRVVRGEIDPLTWNADVWTHRKKDGTLFEVEVRSSSVSFGGRPARLVLAKDISAERRLAAQVRHMQKMDAVGRLAGGMTHDFNNVLFVISGYAEQILRRTPAGETRDKALAITRAAERAAGLTRQLLTFSRKSLKPPAAVELGSLIAQTEELLRGVLGEEIALATAVAPDLWRVRGDPGQIEQVLMNLALNARDAMPEGGQLTIEARNVDMDADNARSHVGLRPGAYVLLAVSDNGTGMDEETQSRMFEPFFTTKPKEKGTGLGLAIVYGVVQQGGGHVEVHSHLGRGTTFKIYLPRTAEGAPAAAAPRAAPARPPVKANATILLAEDDDDARRLARETLEEHGYTVLEAHSQGEAVDLAQKRRPRLLLTDMVLKAMTGNDLARRVAAVEPDIRVLYMSGFTDLALAGQGAIPPGAAFLQKPFTLDSLLRKVQELLAALP